MGNYEPIAYTYEADVHCPACTQGRFGRSEAGFIAEGSVDAEGNQVGAVFSWDEWWQPGEAGLQVLECSDCFNELDRREDVGQ